MSEERINPGHSGIRAVLRVVGPIILCVGLIFIIAGIASFFSAFGSSELPRKFWMAFVGMPLTFVGFVMTSMGFMGKVARYQAQEIAPVAKDTFNYMADGTSEGLKTVASAIGAGLKEGMSSSQGSAKQVTCPQCGSTQDSDAKFCDDCGAAMAKNVTCPQCEEQNDPDAKFCDNCGHRF